MLRCAIIGLGRWGQRLVDSCQLDGHPVSSRLTFTHAVVRSPHKYEQYCAAQKLLLLDDYQTVLSDTDIDAVVLATPHSQHAGQICAAAAAGKHVFVEKPFTLNHQDAITAADAARMAGIVLALGHNRRFLPASIDLKALIDSGELGTVTHMEGNFSGPFGLDYDNSMWRASCAESPAGGMTAMGIHIIDAMINLGGPIANVRAQSLGHVLDVEMDDTTSILMNFENGVSAMFSTLVATARQWRLQVFGTRGWAQMRDHHIFDTCFAEQPHADTKLYDETDIEFAELIAFAEACQNGPAYPVTVADAVHGIAVQDAIIESTVTSGGSVSVADGANWQPAARNESCFPSVKGH